MPTNTEALQEEVMQLQDKNAQLREENEQLRRDLDMRCNQVEALRHNQDGTLRELAHIIVSQIVDSTLLKQTMAQNLLPESVDSFTGDMTRWLGTLKEQAEATRLQKLWDARFQHVATDHERVNFKSVYFLNEVSVTEDPQWQPAIVSVLRVAYTFHGEEWVLQIAREAMENMHNDMSIVLKHPSDFAAKFVKGSSRTCNFWPPPQPFGTMNLTAKRREFWLSVWPECWDDSPPGMGVMDEMRPLVEFLADNISMLTPWIKGKHILRYLGWHVGEESHDYDFPDPRNEGGSRF